MFHSEARKGTEKSIISGKLLSLHNNENGKNLDGTICNEHEVSKDSVVQNSVIGTNGNEDKEPKEKRAKMQ